MTNDFDAELNETSFHDAAIIYRAGRWRRDEAKMLSRFEAGLDGSVLADAAAMFSVARQFPDRDKQQKRRPEHFSEAVHPLREALDGLNDANLINRVVKLSNDFKLIEGLVALGKSGNSIDTISACSKFIWCASPTIGIIYDERARSQLRRLGHTIPRVGYAEFVRAFRLELKRHGEQLDQSLPLLGSLALRPWQKAKLLDFWLYSNGELPHSKP